MSPDAEAALVTGSLTFITAITVLIVGWLLNRKSNRRASDVREAIDNTTLSNSIDHGCVLAAVQDLRQEMKDHRTEFSEYRVEHSREHQLIHRILSSR